MKRPGSVTVVSIYLWIVAISALLVGAVFTLASFADDVEATTGLTSTEVLVAGIVELVIGLLVVWAAMSLAKGGDTARSVVSAVMVIRIVATVVVVAWIHTANYVLAGALHVILPMLVIWALHTERADAWFDAN